MAALRRVSAGGFSVDEAITIAQAQELSNRGEIESRLLPIDSLFQRYPFCIAETEQEKRIHCGNAYPCDLPEGTYRVYSETGEFLMLGKAEDAFMLTIKSFFEV